MTAITRIAALGRAAWPDVPLPDDVIEAHLLRHTADAPDRDAALADLHAADLYLACAAAHGVPGAVAHVRAELVARLPLWLASLRLDAARLDEATQAVVTRLLAPRADAATARIGDYGGRGPLGGWLRVASVRTALNLRESDRPQDRALDAEPERVLGPAGVDVELDVVRQLHREDFTAAFRAALATLEARDRALLGLHWLDGVPTTRLATMYGVHRTTVGRWLEEAQERVLERTRAGLAERLGVTADEADSLIRVLRSRLDVSLRVLRERESGA